MIAKINLAPEVYQSSQRNKQRKRVATTVTGIVCVFFLSIIGVLAIIFGGQQAYLAAINGDIKKFETKLADIPDLKKAVTEQRHLNSVVKLYGNRTYISQFFKDLETIMPTGIGLGSLTVDEANNVTLNASANSFALVDKFAKALQADNVEIGENPALDHTPYFTNISVSSADSDGKGTVQFKVTAQLSQEVLTQATTDATKGSSGSTNAVNPSTPIGNPNVR